MKMFCLPGFCRLLAVAAIMLFFAGQPLSAQKVYSVGNEYRADVKVFVVNNESRADLVVYKTDKESRAKKTENRGIWHFVSTEGRADKRVYFVDKESRADLKVYFTEKESRAGWRNSSKKPLMY